MKADSLSIHSFDYPLPDDRIAKYPLENRDASKLLIYKEGNISESHFTGIPELLDASEILVFNNTKVIRARMLFEKPSGSHIEIFCLHPVDPFDYVLMFQQCGRCRWECIVGNLKKWKSEILTRNLQSGGVLQASLIEKNEQSQIVEFRWPENMSFSDIMDELGCTPIPPYLNRLTEPIDDQRYQTVYSKWKGSVAAPTAGLHFTREVMQKISQKGTSQVELTLHVGAGTFKPVKKDRISEHTMHTEFFTITLESLRRIRSHCGHVVAVGTTSLRTLESIYWLAVKIHRKEIDLLTDNFVEQWYPYKVETFLTSENALDLLIEKMETNQLTHLNASTQIMCVPGYSFNMVDKLITNFHQPKSTLLLLIAAFIGDDWEDVYRYALTHQFRFLSYGDSSFLVKNPH